MEKGGLPVLVQKALGSCLRGNIAPIIMVGKAAKRSLADQAIAGAKSASFPGHVLPKVYTVSHVRAVEDLKELIRWESTSDQQTPIFAIAEGLVIPFLEHTSLLDTVCALETYVSRIRTQGVYCDMDCGKRARLMICSEIQCSKLFCIGCLKRLPAPQCCPFCCTPLVIS